MGWKKNVEEAPIWFNSVCENAEASKEEKGEAYFRLGSIFYKSTLLGSNYIKAIEFFVKSGKLEFVYAFYI